MPAPFTLQIDPVAIAPGRVMLDLNTGPISVGAPGGGVGVDWGVAQITEYATQQGAVGNSVSSFVIPNRTITIPLLLGGTHYEAQAETARAQLQAKVALLQREGGQLLRQRAGGPAMYADIVDAQLTIPDVWGETGEVEPGVTLVLICLPDFYGDEVTLDTLTGSDVITGVLKASGAQAVIAGDYPARCRLIVSDTSGNNQRAMLWGLRSRHYDPASTAALFYEAEALTPINGSAVEFGPTQSGSHGVSSAALSAASWLPILSTSLSGGSALTHQGSYRCWARAGTGAIGTTVALRLLWGAGSLAVPVTNPAASVTGDGSFHLLDLGTIRLDAPPVGASAWYGAIQAMLGPGSASDYLTLDCIYLQPVDDGAGQLTYTSRPSAAALQAGPASPTAGANNAATGTVAWANPANVTSLDGVVSTAAFTAAGQKSEYLVASGFGFAIPSGSTIDGIQAVAHYNFVGSTAPSYGFSFGPLLAKAGVVQPSSYKSTYQYGGQDSFNSAIASYGSAADLWGQTLTSTDINSTGFGVAFTATCSAVLGGTANFNVDYMAVTVWYTLATGFTIAQDAVVYASRTAELRSEGMFRTADGVVYGPVSQVVGALPRLPPSGDENRAVQLFAKPSRGDLATLPDAGLDALSATVKYRPCFLSRP